MWRSQHQIIVEIYLLCTGGYYARLICNVTPVVQWSHSGVCRVVFWLPFHLSSLPTQRGWHSLKRAVTFYSVIQSSREVQVSYWWGGINFTGLSWQRRNISICYSVFTTTIIRKEIIVIGSMEHAMYNVIWGATWNVSWSIECEFER